MFTWHYELFTMLIDIVRTIIWPCVLMFVAYRVTGMVKLIADELRQP